MWQIPVSRYCSNIIYGLIWTHLLYFWCQLFLFGLRFVVHLQKQLSENVFIDERRPVLLCDGKLCLRALQDLFNLTIVEMLYGKCKSVRRMSEYFLPLLF